MTQVITPHPSPELLAAFDLGQLQAATWAEVEQHIATCAECCGRLEALPDDPLVQLVRRANRRANETVAQPLAATGGAGAALTPVPPELANHPRYRIVGPLGSGGMGVVFKAEHRLMERTVALKVVNARLLDQPAAVERFRQEVKAAARLTHPNIVTAYDAEQAAAIHFLVMEFVDGQSLDRVLEQRGPLPVAEACDWIRQAALGLQHAHEQGMVHRDIKPANLLLGVVSGGVVSGNNDLRLTTHPSPLTYQVKVLDFGLARFASETADLEALTVSGAVVGTPDYVAPEQAADSRSADIRADLYSLGCTLYHLLTGRPPFPGGTVLQKLIAHRETPAPSAALQRPDLPAPLAALIARLLAKDPAQRPQTPAELARELAVVAQAPADPEPRPVAASRPAGSQERQALRMRQFNIIGSIVLFSALAGLFLVDLLTSDKPVSPVASTPAAAPATRPAPVVLTKEMHRQARDQAVAWIEKNNTFGGKGTFVVDQVKRIDGAQAQGGDCLLTFGPSLVKSKRETFLAVRGGQFFVLDKDAETLGAYSISPTGTHYSIIGRDPAPRLLPPPAQLSDLQLDHAAGLQADRDITGSVACAIPPDLSGNLALRVTTTLDGKRYHQYSEVPADRPGGRVRFNGRRVVPPGSRYEGPLWVFVELRQLIQSPDPGSSVIVSNAVAAVVIVLPAK